MTDQPQGLQTEGLASPDQAQDRPVRQLEGIIRDGKKSGEFPPDTNPKSAARAFLHATSPFHHPALVMQQPSPTEAEGRALLGLVLAGLRAGGNGVR